MTQHALYVLIHFSHHQITNWFATMDHSSCLSPDDMLCSYLAKNKASTSRQLTPLLKGDFSKENVIYLLEYAEHSMFRCKFNILLRYIADTTINELSSYFISLVMRQKPA